jgi:2-oxoglutarate dehydrogenase E2 component (dihydrolipoamide succinyltransferase)
VNAPQAGTIKEFLAQEEDTVTVGQDLIRLELGGEAPAKEESKPAETKEEKSTPSESNEPSPPRKESAPAPAQEQPKKASPPPKQSESKANESKTTSAPGNREERRVSSLGLY